MTLRTQPILVTFAEPPELFTLQSGVRFGPITLAYETYGTLSPEKDNAILVFHALSGSSHAAGECIKKPNECAWWRDECRIGWWDGFVGPGKFIDTDQYYVICANYLGGCYGSTGPSSIDPETGTPYGSRFPRITLTDIVRTQRRLLDHLGIDRLLCAIGGSLGGILALEFAVRYPERVRLAAPIACGAAVTTLQKVHNFEQIFAIEEDPNFRYGDYYDGHPPSKGLALARMIAHKTYISLSVMDERARSSLIQEEDDLKGYRLHHQIESYMLHQGKKFVTRFDANSYLRIVDAWQSFDLARQYGEGDLIKAFRRLKETRMLIISIDSDVCFYPDEQREMVEALKSAGAEVEYLTIHSDKGHDSFLLEPNKFGPYVAHLLEKERARR